MPNTFVVMHSFDIYLVQAVAVRARAFATNSHDIFNIHRHEPHNNWQTQFAFTPDNLEKAKKIMANYPDNYQASAVIPLLDLAQQQNAGFLSLAAMNSIAELLGMAPIRVYEVATFYTMFNRSPMGRYHVMVCGTTPCMLQGSKGIYKAISDHLGVVYGQTTEDKLFTLSEMECMGACVNAPMIAVADYSGGVEKFSYIYYEDLTPEDAISILETLRRGEKPKVGSQHRYSAEPAGTVAGDKWIPSKPGQEVTLRGEPSGPYCRNLDQPLDAEAPKA